MSEKTVTVLDSQEIQNRKSSLIGRADGKGSTYQPVVGEVVIVESVERETSMLNEKEYVYYMILTNKGKISDASFFRRYAKTIEGKEFANVIQEGGVDLDYTKLVAGATITVLKMVEGFARNYDTKKYEPVTYPVFTM